MSKNTANKPAAPKTADKAAEAKSVAHTEAVASLVTLVASLGAQQVLLTVGQQVNRNATDLEEGLKFARKMVNLSKKVPALAS